jgi:hypothetical protein
MVVSSNRLLLSGPSLRLASRGQRRRETARTGSRVRTMTQPTNCLANSPQAASAAPRKRGLHKARDDILESIEEARYYRSAIFQPAGP